MFLEDIYCFRANAKSNKNCLLLHIGKFVNSHCLVNPRSTNHNNCLYFKNHCCKQCRSSLIWVHTVCLYAKCKFEKFARRCSRGHKQTTFSDADFLGALRLRFFLKYTLQSCAIILMARGAHDLPSQLCMHVHSILC